MASKIKVDQIEGSTGSSITIPSGQTLTITDGLAASTIGSGTLADARIPNLNASKITAGTISAARLGSGTADATTFLRGDGTFAAAGGGKINQVLQMEYENGQSFSTSSGTYSNTGVTLNITPTATSSKIVGWAFYNCGVGSDVYMYLRISRTAPSSAVVCNRIGHTPQSGAALIDAGSMHFIDSPNTTSQCTYTLQLDGGGGTAKLNDRGDGSSGAGTSGIMLMEVLA
jgi:hypothetical protein